MVTVSEPKYLLRSHVIKQVWDKHDHTKNIVHFLLSDYVRQHIIVEEWYSPWIWQSGQVIPVCARRSMAIRDPLAPGVLQSCIKPGSETNDMIIQKKLQSPQQGTTSTWVWMMCSMNFSGFVEYKQVIPFTFRLLFVGTWNWNRKPTQLSITSSVGSPWSGKSTHDGRSRWQPYIIAECHGEHK